MNKKKVKSVKNWNPKGYWYKTYKGHILTISPKQLGFRTREESVKAFEKWFTEQTHKIDMGTWVSNRKRVQRKAEKQRADKVAKPVKPFSLNPTDSLTLSDKFNQLACLAGKPGKSVQEEMIGEAVRLGFFDNPKKITVYHFLFRTKKKQTITWDFSPGGVVYSPEHLKVIYESRPGNTPKLLRVECRTTRTKNTLPEKFR